MQGVEAGIVGAVARNPSRAHDRIDVAILDRGAATFNDVLALLEEAAQPLDYDVVFLDRADPTVRAAYLSELRSFETALLKD